MELFSIRIQRTFQLVSTVLIQFSRHLRSIFIRSVTYLFLEQSGKMLRVLKTEIIGDFINGVVCRCKFRLGYFNRLVMNEMQGG